MQIKHLSYPLQEESFSPCSLAIGYFDGIHLGHRRVIQRARDIAKEKGWISAVMTFHPHPREILGQSGYSHYLTPLSEKLNYLNTLGIDIVYVVHFDIAFSSVYPEDFVDEVLIPLQAKQVVVGFDYNFGYKGKGTAFTLKEYSRNRYEVDVVSPITKYGEKVSSTIIREYLYGGKIKEANAFLGRPYRIKGSVIHGEKRGRQIGFPTANLKINDPYFIPRTGVYGVQVFVGEKSYYGVMNIGIKPTFEQEKKEKSIEVHIFDFKDSIYDQEVQVDIHFFIREEQKFAGVDHLIKQIKRDVEITKERFGLLEA